MKNIHQIKLVSCPENFFSLSNCLGMLDCLHEEHSTNDLHILDCDEALAYPGGGGGQISKCLMVFSSIRTFNVRVLQWYSRTSWSIQLKFLQPIALAFSPSAISTTHQFAFIFGCVSRSKYCIQTCLSDGYLRCSLSDFLVHQLCIITGSKNVDYEQAVSMQSFWIYNCCSLQFCWDLSEFWFLRMTRFIRIVANVAAFGSKMIKKLLFPFMKGGLCTKCC